PCCATGRVSITTHQPRPTSHHPPQPQSRTPPVTCKPPSFARPPPTSTITPESIPDPRSVPTCLHPPANWPTPPTLSSALDLAPTRVRLARPRTLALTASPASIR